MDSHAIVKEREEIDTFLSQVEIVEKDACNNVINNLKRKRDTCMTTHAKKRRLLESKKNKWTKIQLEEKQEEVSYFIQSVIFNTLIFIIC